MINDGKNNVPDNTIVFFPKVKKDGTLVSLDEVNDTLEQCGPKRQWFTPHFYRCLPLTIANSYGFLIKSQYTFSVVWNGGNDRDDVKFFYDEPIEEIDKKYPKIWSHFGSGIITINPPFVLKTPPGVNLLTINPPNYVIPNITVMTGAVESDNLRSNFTFNLKIQIPNIEVVFPAGVPLAGFIPLPRYYADGFKLQNCSDIFDQVLIDEEYEAHNFFDEKRLDAIKNNKFGIDRDYYLGKDSFGNPFRDHQKP